MIELSDWQLATGYDLDSFTWHELDGRRPPSAPSTPPAIEPFDLRSLVAHEHHPEVEQLVADARAAVPLRDDNGAITGAWPMGLLRRAMIEAGRRLALDDPAVAVEATVGELAARLGGRSTRPTAISSGGGQIARHVHGSRRLPRSDPSSRFRRCAPCPVHSR